MPKTELSPREKEIVELAAEGLTNESIADQLGLSVGTVNTYWLRIKLKVGGTGRTETVVNIFKERAALALHEERVDWEGLEAILAKRQVLEAVVEKFQEMELRTALALLHLALDKVQSAVWAVDKDLIIQVIVNEALPTTIFGVTWEVGKTVYELFNTKDKTDPVVAAHLAALAGSANEVRVSGVTSPMLLKVVPLSDETGEVFCCLSTLSGLDI